MTHHSSQPIELLAPAKTAEFGIAAIACGADAVYIGAARFGAREQAGNSVADIARLTAFAHRYWARVYVALNTLLHDDEFPAALRLIAELYDAGVDGLIIQDVGLLECDLPPLPLIASTQMHNNTPEKVAFLEQVGFQRAILARELSLDQIRAIRERAASIELECFAHGAVCVCYSGQCYLSYAIGGRSGNRGQCAQPCRKRYALRDANGRILSQNRHLLSLKDMCRAAALRELLDAGVASFKIEGRLKDLAYVRNIVSFYRQQLDAIFEDRHAAFPSWEGQGAGKHFRKASSGRSVIDFAPDPVKTFNRGYTEYFLTGSAEPVAALDTPKSIGERIGSVTRVTPTSFTLSAAAPLHNGDGLCFFDSRRELQGTVVNSAQGDRVTPASMQGIQAGTVIFRNADRLFLKQVENSRAERVIGVTLILRDAPDGFALTAIDEDGVEAEERLICEKIPAKNADAALTGIDKQLAKFGGTEFHCAEARRELASPYFFPAAQLNALRRAVLDALRNARARRRPAASGGVKKNAAPYPERQLSFLGNVLNRYADAFYRRHGVAQIEPAAESGLDMRGRKVMTTKYCLRRELGFCAKYGGSADPLAEPLFLIDEQGAAYRLDFRCAACEMDIYFPDNNRVVAQ